MDAPASPTDLRQQCDAYQRLLGADSFATVVFVHFQTSRLANVPDEGLPKLLAALQRRHERFSSSTHQRLQRTAGLRRSLVREGFFGIAKGYSEGRYR